MVKSCKMSRHFLFCNHGHNNHLIPPVHPSHDSKRQRTLNICICTTHFNRTFEHLPPLNQHLWSFDEDKWAFLTRDKDLDVHAHVWRRGFTQSVGPRGGHQRRHHYFQHLPALIQSCVQSNAALNVSYPQPPPPSLFMLQAYQSSAVIEFEAFGCS